MPEVTGSEFPEDQFCPLDLPRGGGPETLVESYWQAQYGGLGAGPGAWILLLVPPPGRSPGCPEVSIEPLSLALGQQEGTLLTGQRP